MNDQCAKYLSIVPAQSRGIVKKAFEGASSPRQAIKAKCLTCANFDRAEISLCRVLLCPLHAFRPYRETEAR